MKKIIPLILACISALAADSVAQPLQVQLIRSATVKITINHRHLLTDPILADKGTEPPIFFADERKNPTIDLPFHHDSILKDVDAILLTHYHPDHFDGAAEKYVPKDMLIFCQPGDDAKLKEKGFTNTRVIDSLVTWEGVSFHRFLSSHYPGANGEPPFGISSSYYLQSPDGAVFITGDAILDDKLKASLITTKPPIVIANTGECHFTRENPVLAPGITMTLTTGELKAITRLLPATTVIAVHMDAINHCSLSKADLRRYVAGEKLQNRIKVPQEGETVRGIPGNK
ncbi:L-ascorbate metabolism protein UlaG, beta-lactamase superfamily [Chitinophaga eiseniae]|uniref:L-ascorbate metabolism protein UlaG, beta-lactamase superfamily n=1 Tax=Chitinophaga eiseniae TaxID=634771 RepID=A0A1T4TC09_9BACT|nr:MBL fold metallo-hydrolase [Chitinophaga eiseniae]SKA37963.1 L-ascorbate metabolism protein UlaG, beta-lactamase superfamily [Chitinophaga eiseniae]